MIRVTTNGVLNGYKSSLMRSRNKLEVGRNQVLTQRNFNSFAENPAAATHAFQLRRSAWETDAQLTTSDSVIKKYESAFKIIMTTNDELGNEANGGVLQGLNDATGTGRKALGKTLTKMADSIVQNLNTKYGAAFIFGGSDGDKVPFSWEVDKGLMFQGIPVDTAEKNADGTPSKDYEKLKAMAGQTTFVDLGLGLQEDPDTGKLIPASAFNSALSGLNFLGYGVDSDGDPVNLASIVKELGSILSNCGPDSDPPDKKTDGNWNPPADQERALRLQKKLEGALSTLRNAHSELTTKAGFLNTNHERLEDNFDTVNEQILGVEQIEMADAINNFSWAQYCYNAALKVGNSILSESLIDYMR